MRKKSTLSKKLTKYSALSAAFFGLSEANGQIEYTDVPAENEEIYSDSSTGGSVSIDVNDDSTNDFRINNFVFSYSLGFLFVGDNTTQFNPNKLSSNDVIDASNPGGTWGNQLTIYSRYYGNVTVNTGCTPGFYAFRIPNGGGYNYGWIEAEVSPCDGSGNSSFFLRGYAVEQTVDEPILAGDTTGSSLSTIENTVSKKFNHALNGKELVLSEGANNIVVYNTNGQQVLNAAVINNKVSLANLSTGVYVVNANTDSGLESFKVLIK